MSDFIGSMLSRLVTKAFAPRPTIKKEGVFLVIQSGWRTALLTLCGRHRRVAVDPQSKIIHVRDRRFWFFIDRKVYAFDRIQEIIYSYSDLFNSDWFSHDSEDLFRVGFWLRDGKEIILFRFFGQGEFVNNSIWPDWMMWGDILPGQIVTRDMDSASERLANLLGQMVGVPVGNGIP